MPKRKPKPFQLLAGHSALDLVNTLDNRFIDSGAIELMPVYKDLLRFMQQSGLLRPSKLRQLARCPAAAAASLVQQVHTLREALATVFYSTSEPMRASALQIVQRFAMQAGKPPAGNRRRPLHRRRCALAMGIHYGFCASSVGTRRHCAKFADRQRFPTSAGLWP